MDAVEYLFGLERFGIKLGLETIGTLCRALGHPEASFRSVLVAGTNGKGSVTAMVETGLRAAGHRTGRYTSPHLVRLEERFAIAGRPVDASTLGDAAGTVREVVERLRMTEAIPAHPTFFEATTAVAFELFRREKVDIAVLEVGLGGRYDATNVVTPLVGAITGIALDHERYLGHTLPEIAYEKAGIIKPWVPIVVGGCPEDAMAVIARVARDRQAPLVHVGVGIRLDSEMRSDGLLQIDVATPVARYGPFTLGLRGRHQAENALVAVGILEQLSALGVVVPSDAVVQGLSGVRWPGRLDLVSGGRGRFALLDAAHNPAGARVLAAYLQETTPPLPIVFGSMRDKDTSGMLAALAPCASRFVFTQPSNPRAMPAIELEQVLERVAPGAPRCVRNEPAVALEAAWHLAPTICVAGSVFLVGDVLRLLDDGREQSDPSPA
jgi:dihydrofolate synthase/folylpolyglutamate synthase